jgi:Isoleucyl-tRNA synthetase
MDYKDTINLPKTDFPMKANLSEKEPEILKRWEGLYEKLRAQRKGNNFLYCTMGHLTPTATSI